MPASKLKNLIVPIFFILLIFTLRLPSFFEPAWYGDELIRLVVAREWFSGRALYLEIFDNSPPLLYLIFGLAGNVFLLKLASYVFVVAATLAFYFLASKLSQSEKISKFYPITASLLFIITTSTPIFEGNIASAEIFVLAPTISAMYLTWLIFQFKNNLKKRLAAVAAGLLFAAATLIRIQSIVDLLAAAVFLTIFKKSRTALELLPVFTLVWLGIFIATYITGVWESFFNSLFLSNLSYVNFSSQLIIPFGFLILKFAIVILALFILFFLKKYLTTFEIFIIIWLVFSFFGASIGGRGFPHYLIQITPAASLFVALVLRKKIADFAKIFGFLVALGIFFVVGQFYLPRTLSYYANFGKFFTNLEKYQAWFDPRLTATETIAKYITSKTGAGDKILVLGDAPEIYLLAKRPPVGKYVVSYHLNFQENAKIETLSDFVNNPPKIVVVFPEGKNQLPELMPIISKTYVATLKIGQGQIWEAR